MLSPRMVRTLAAHFPGTVHVRDVGLLSASDQDVWAAAKTSGRTLVSKDSDFVSLAGVRGAPPRVVWVRAGNASSSQIESLLLRHAGDIRAFGASGDAVLALG
jgi:predicted nuclease of predicted toxin-antitoxin system